MKEQGSVDSFLVSTNGYECLQDIRLDKSSVELDNETFNL